MSRPATIKGAHAGIGAGYDGQYVAGFRGCDAYGAADDDVDAENHDDDCNRDKQVDYDVAQSTGGQCRFQDARFRISGGIVSVFLIFGLL